MIPLADCEIIKLEKAKDHPTKFDCGDSDLNDFLLEDAFNHHLELFSKTYLVTHKGELAGFFTLLNDKISCEDFSETGTESKNNLRKKLKNLLRSHGVPNIKRGFKSYPAVKIARLAVASDFKQNRIGEQLLDLITSTFVTNNRTGCRFITVDAYAKALGFYKKNGFELLVDKTGEDTESMFFDLKPLSDALEKNK